jgi:DNA-directed RNA polymerase specialized sigma24 family protein
VQAAAGASLGRVRDLGARHRSLLFTVAYEMLGSASDAEDVVQETWLRWVDVAADVELAESLSIAMLTVLE